MKSQPRIPRSENKFHIYLINIYNYLKDGNPANYIRLGLTTDDIKFIDDFKAEWVPKYELYMNKKLARTTTIVGILLALIQKFVDWDQENSILDRIGSSPNVTVADLKQFNIKKGELKKLGKEGPKVAIKEPVNANISQLGGGEMKIACKSSTGKRPAIFEDADSLEFMYLVGETPPKSPNDNGLRMGLSTRGSFVLNLGPESHKNYLYIYIRWYLTKHPDLAGPWTELHTNLIV